jgi:outer membrane lipoprotein-sorting protein
VKKLLTITLVFVFALALVLAIGCAKKETPATESQEQGMQQSTTPDTSTTTPMDSTHMGGH